MPGAPTPTAGASWSATARLPRERDGRIELGHHVGDGVHHLDAGVTRLVHESGVCRGGGRGDARLRNDRVEGAQRDPENLGPADVDPERDLGIRRRPGAGGHDDDSTRAFSSRRAVDMMRLWARILMKPGIGTRSSASRWYRTCVPEPSAGSKT